MPDEKPTGADLRGADAETRREAARLMGQAATEAKAKAARENGKRGGRPKGMVVSEETRRKISESRRDRNRGQPGSELPSEGADEERG